MWKCQESNSELRQWSIRDSVWVLVQHGRFGMWSTSVGPGAAPACPADSFLWFCGWPSDHEFKVCCIGQPSFISKVSMQTNLFRSSAPCPAGLCVVYMCWCGYEVSREMLVRQWWYGLKGRQRNLRVTTCRYLHPPPPPSPCVEWWFACSRQQNESCLWSSAKFIVHSVRVLCSWQSCIWTTKLQPVSCSFQHRIFELLSPHVAHSTKRHVEAVWKKIDRAFTVHSTDSASQLMGSTVHLHGLLACVPHGWDAEAESSLNLNTKQRCVQGCWKLHETGCIWPFLHSFHLSVSFQ